MTALRRAIGCMTGTSLDGLDVALVTARGHGLAVEVEAVAFASSTFGGEIDALRAFAAGEPLPAADIADLALMLSHRHADLILATWPGLRPDLVAMHGQTVTHSPPRSWQLANPWPLATALDCPVVFDLRGADLAGGGRGAPITPLADAILYRGLLSPTSTVLIVNLGGFANASVLPGADPRAAYGFDCCPCNHLLDAASRALIDRPFDEGGLLAAGGSADESAVEPLRRAIGSLAVEGRSGGDGDEQRDRAVAVARAVADAGTPADALATIALAIAGAVVDAIQRQGLDARDPGSTIHAVVLAGGGSRNAALVAALTREITLAFPAARVLEGLVAGVAPMAREAAAMAVLGLVAADGCPITGPATTGRRDGIRLDGCWTR